MFKVIKRFIDLKDDNHVYNEGDKFPWDGRRVSKKRIEELSTAKNKRGIPLIAKDEEK